MMGNKMAPSKQPEAESSNEKLAEPGIREQVEGYGRESTEDVDALFEEEIPQEYVDAAQKMFARLDDYIVFSVDDELKKEYEFHKQRLDSLQMLKKYGKLSELDVLAFQESSKIVEDFEKWRDEGFEAKQRICRAFKALIENVMLLQDNQYYADPRTFINLYAIRALNQKGIGKSQTMNTLSPKIERLKVLLLARHLKNSRWFELEKQKVNES